MCDEKFDVLQQYQNISNRLKKKRILKKPNIAEAGQQFENLGKLCEREDLEQYAGLSYSAAAKCQNSLGNHLEEAFLLLRSSKQYLSAYTKLLDNQFVTNDSYLKSAYMHYKECLEALQRGKEPSDLAKEMMAGGLNLEMGDVFKEKIGDLEKARKEFEKALKTFSKSPVERIICLEKLADCFIESGDYCECLKLMDEISKEADSLPDVGFKEDALKNAEITKILLLLILRPTPQQISPAAASSLEKYAWVETSNAGEMKNLETTLASEGLSMLSEDLFLTLQSLVMACQYADAEALASLQTDLMPYLKVEQKTLFNVLIKQYVS